MAIGKPIEFDRLRWVEVDPSGVHFMVCQECGALVEFYSEDVHRQWHEYVSGKEDSKDE
jgi:Fe2+ or Zn2+ uptake regulation protein